MFVFKRRNQNTYRCTVRGEKSLFRRWCCLCGLKISMFMPSPHRSLPFIILFSFFSLILYTNGTRWTRWNRKKNKKNTTTYKKQQSPALPNAAPTTTISIFKCKTNYRLTVVFNTSASLNYFIIFISFLFFCLSLYVYV